MSEKLLNTNHNTKKYIIYFLVIFCFVAIPGFIISYSVYRFYQTNEEELVYNLKVYAQHIITDLRRNISAEKYFCELFYNFNKKEDSKIETCLDFCKKQKETYGNNIDFIIVNDNADVIYNSNPHKNNFSNKDLKISFKFIKEILSNYQWEDFDSNKEAYESLKKIFGPQLITNQINSIYNKTLLSLYWADSSDKRWPGAIYPFKWGGFFVFISKDLLKDTSHLKYCLIDKTKNDDYITGIYRIDKINDFSFNKEIIQNSFEIKDSLNDSKIKLKNFITTDNYYICNQSLTKNINIFIANKKHNTDYLLLIKSLLVFIFYFIISTPIIKYFWNTIILNKSGKASIRLKISFLFFFATGIPLLIFSVVAHEYELHKRLSLINEAKAWSIGRLLTIENKYRSFLKKMSNELNIFIDKWGKKLKKDGLNIDNNVTLSRKLDSLSALDYYCVSSETKYLAGFDCLVKINGSLDQFQFDYDNSIYNPYFTGERLKRLLSVTRLKNEDFKFTYVIAQKIFSELNGKKISEVMMSKIEIVFENILQKKFSEILYSVTDRVNNIKEWGFVNRVLLTYFRFISCNKDGVYDYIIIATWRPWTIQDYFVKDFIEKENKNPINFKIIAYEKYVDKLFPETIKDDKATIVDFANKATDNPTEELEIIKFNGEDYIAVSLIDNNVNRYCFIGLYPVSNINQKMSNTSFILWLLGILSLILAISLAQILTKSFVQPLLNLREGALAIENRNFNYRLSLSNVDEFGKVSSIFNHMMVGLEELEIAKIIQESLFPKPEFNQGKFSIYGKSVTMIDVGGDYLDFFKIDENSFAVLLGDVAGHGVGAAVIMAMAKATILVSGDYLRSPATMLNELHKIILSAKSDKQKKIMTFQYMYVNSDTGENLYSNAGGCSPCLVRHSTNSIVELKKPGPVLGAFKKAKYTDTSIDFIPGDAIIFYTDGIVECKNKYGEMLGYDNMKYLLLKSYDPDPQIYYNNIYEAYLDYIGIDSKAEDDLTIIVLMYSI